MDILLVAELSACFVGLAHPPEDGLGVEVQAGADATVEVDADVEFAPDLPVGEGAGADRADGATGAGAEGFEVEHDAE